MSERDPRNSNDAIALSQIPEEIQESVKVLWSLETKERWQLVTQTWDVVFRNIARALRAKTQTERNNVAKNTFESLGDAIDPHAEDFDKGAHLFACLTCLSDQQLDLAIASFTPSKH